MPTYKVVFESKKTTTGYITADDLDGLQTKLFYGTYETTSPEGEVVTKYAQPGRGTDTWEWTQDVSIVGTTVSATAIDETPNTNVPDPGPEPEGFGIGNPVS